MSVEELATDGPYSGYFHTGTASEDKELTHVGPSSPGGEYLRRFWHPISMSSELGDLPLLVRILGEDLVLFRDLGGRLGLLHRHCVHRRASLEYGKLEERGIRCCYHGWLFDVDGTILETPGEPADSKGAEKMRCTDRQGAYPVREYRGLIFAYLGPSDKTPEFPMFDSFEIPGVEMVPYTRDYPCNWLQITENAMDPVHAVFLHAQISGPQFADTWGLMGVRDFHEKETGFFYTNARRVDDNIWVRVHEIILPNITLAGAVLSMDGRKVKYFGRNSFTRWVVPVDDTHSKVVAWVYFSDRADPPRDDWKTTAGIDVIEGGELRDRSFEAAQRKPGDYEVFVSQGPVAIHKSEHLMASDNGVAMMRIRLRREIRALKNGGTPFQPSDLGDPSIPTYCGDSVLRIPPAGNGDDEALILEVSRRVAQILVDGDQYKGEERDAYIVDRLKDYEATMAGRSE